MTLNYLDQPILIHCCKDRTLSFRAKDEPIFNGVALPVFSVPTKKDANDLILLVGRKQYVDHPDMPGQPWYRMTLDGQLDFKPHLDLDDLDAVTAKLQWAWDHIVRRRQES